MELPLLPLRVGVSGSKPTGARGPYNTKPGDREKRSKDRLEAKEAASGRKAWVAFLTVADKRPYIGYDGPDGAYMRHTLDLEWKQVPIMPLQSKPVPFDEAIATAIEGWLECYHHRETFSAPMGEEVPWVLSETMPRGFENEDFNLMFHSPMWFARINNVPPGRKKYNMINMVGPDLLLQIMYFTFGDKDYRPRHLNKKFWQGHEYPFCDDD